jgi:YVTN family beta-propeller protein
VNTADDRLEVFSTTGASLVRIASIPVGIDPVSVRARTNGEAWVVNSISDTVSIVNLTTGNVVATLKTEDEPADVVFAGTPSRAFVSCAQTNKVLVFDPANLATAPLRSRSWVKNRARSLAASTGRRSTSRSSSRAIRRRSSAAGTTMASGFPKNVVTDATGPVRRP